MKKILIAATLIAAFAAPALAMDSFYIMFDKTTKSAPWRGRRRPTPRSSA